MLLLVPPGELDLARAPGPLPASTAASSIEAAREELLGEVRIVLGGYCVDKRDLPAEQGKGVSCQQTGQSRLSQLERLLRDKGRVCLPGAESVRTLGFWVRSC